MSAAIYISSQVPSSADQIAVNGKHILLHIENISSIGEEYGLKRLDEYISYSPDETLEFFDKSMLTPEQSEMLSQELWFDPKEGLALIVQYIDLVERYHSLSETTKKQCLEELKSYISVLEILAQENIQWHFSCDI
jgi:hypothetical protein